jgi:hypothetical protein
MIKELGRTVGGLNGGSLVFYWRTALRRTRESHSANTLFVVVVADLLVTIFSLIDIGYNNQTLVVIN